MLGFGPISSAPIGASIDAARDRGRRTLEEYVGIPIGILDRIRDADDWTFVLQIHGLMEVAVDHLATANVPLVTKDWVLTLNLQGKGSKVEFGEAHETLTSDDTALIKNLSRLRARFAHNIRMTEVRLSDFVNDAKNKDLFNGLFNSVFVGSDMPRDPAERRTWLIERPRDTLFIAVSGFLRRAFEVRVIEKHGLAMEGGQFLANEDGTILVNEDAPEMPDMR